MSIVPTDAGGMHQRRGQVVAIPHADGSPPYRVRWLDDVTAEGVVRGMVSESDLLRGQAVPDPDQPAATTDFTATQVMTPEPVTMGPNDDLADVVAVMLDRGVRSVPSIEDWRLVGIVGRRDACGLSRGASCPNDAMCHRVGRR